MRLCWTRRSARSAPRCRRGPPRTAAARARCAGPIAMSAHGPIGAGPPRRESHRRTSSSTPSRTLFGDERADSQPGESGAFWRTCASRPPWGRLGGRHRGRSPNFTGGRSWLYHAERSRLSAGDGGRARALGHALPPSVPESCPSATTCATTSRAGPVELVRGQSTAGVEAATVLRRADPRLDGLGRVRPRCSRRGGEGHVIPRPRRLRAFRKQGPVHA